jgi:hypothetical protein
MLHFGLLICFPKVPARICIPGNIHTLCSVQFTLLIAIPIFGKRSAFDLEASAKLAELHASK